jgi:putative photosynthetic complex assembly protein 2
MTLLSNPAVAVLSALFVWWFGTGFVLYVVGLAARTFRWSALAAAVLFAVSLWGLADRSSDVSVAGAYLAFTWAVVLWGTQELGFLLGFLTGPRSDPCPADCVGWRRVACAINAILYHEIALIVSAAAVLAVTWGGPNQVGAWTFVILWAMRLSAKLNLFLGVPILHAEFLPDHLRYLSSYFTKKPINLLFPASVTVSTIVAVALVRNAAAPEISSADAIGFTLLAAILILGIVEHWLMLLPLPFELLWSWGMRSRAASPPDVAIVHPVEAAEQMDVREPDNARPQSLFTARQRLEDRIRQAFVERKAQIEITPLRRDASRTPAANWRRQ